MLKARVGLLSKEPMFGHLAMKLDLVEDSKCETSWTDGRRLGFNPEWLAGVETIAELESIMAHHVATCALSHPFRRGTRDAKLWNEASDHCVNEYVTKAGFSLPAGSTYDPKYDGMYVEQVYAQLKVEQGDGEDGPQDQPGADGAPGQDGDGTGSGGQRGGDQSGGDQPGESDDGESGDSPGDADGADSGQGASPTGEVRDATGEDGEAASDAERADQEADWSTSVAQAAQAAKGAGRLSGDAERLALAAAQPRVDWREALQRLLRARAKEDYSMRRPNKRLMPFGLIAPSLDSVRCGPLGFAVDYSSSITQSNVDQFTAEVEDARATIRPESVVVMVFTTDVVKVLEFGDGEPIELPPVRSGGGTDFAPPILAFNEREVQPEVVVYLTDLDCSSFAPEPEYPVVWVSTKPGNPPYGEVIQMY